MVLLWVLGRADTKVGLDIWEVIGEVSAKEGKGSVRRPESWKAGLTLNKKQGDRLRGKAWASHPSAGFYMMAGCGWSDKGWAPGSFLAWSSLPCLQPSSGMEGLLPPRKEGDIRFPWTLSGFPMSGFHPWAVSHSAEKPRDQQQSEKSELQLKLTHVDFFRDAFLTFHFIPFQCFQYENMCNR